MSRIGTARRISLVAISLGTVTTAVLLIGGSGASVRDSHSSTFTTTSTSGLKAVTGGSKSITNAPTTTLPPSRDNDAGHSRIHDQYPDADVDWYQWH